MSVGVFHVMAVWGGRGFDMWRATATELKASFSFQSKREARAPFIRKAGHTGPSGIRLCLTTISTVSFSCDRQFTEENLDKPLSEQVGCLLCTHSELIMPLMTT